MSKKKRVLPIAAAVLGTLGIYFGYQYFFYVTTDNAQVQGKIVYLAAKTPGFISKIYVKENQRVKQGDTLLEIDERDYGNNLKQAESEMASLEAKTTDASRNLSRIQKLFQSGAVTQQQLDTASTLERELASKLEAVKAQVAQAHLNYENTKIRAPFDGYIAKKSAEIGQLAGSGTPLIGFVEAHERWITANFKETEIQRIKIGAPVSIDVDAIDGKTFEGEIESFGASTGSTFTLLPPDNATGNFTKVVQRVPVKIALKNLSDQDVFHLKTGLSAYVKVKVH